MAELSYVFLHGFLGRPADWMLVTEALGKQAQVKTQAVDYFSVPSISPKNQLSTWSLNFGEWVRANLGSGPHCLVGYSMGGRLALHGLEAHPDLFHMGICISTNPGIFMGGSTERTDKQTSDEKWAQRFLRDPWKVLMKDWNAQEVFTGSQSEPLREDSDYRRDLLAKSLFHWSTAKQKDFRAYLSKPSQPVAWIVGENDSKYMQMAKDLMHTCPKLNYQVIAKAGHRVPFDAPEALAKNIFLTTKNLLKID